MAYTIAFFGTKPYDEASFNDKNKEFGFEFRYYKGHLNKNNVFLTQGVDAVCIFVNDTADAEVINAMAANGVKLLALRCAGFNNVDLNAAANAGITVVRVPAYSPYAAPTLFQVRLFPRIIRQKAKVPTVQSSSLRHARVLSEAIPQTYCGRSLQNHRGCRPAECIHIPGTSHPVSYASGARNL